MRKPNALVALAVGLLIGWFIAEKGWHRHVLYMGVIVALVSVIARMLL